MFVFLLFGKPKLKDLCNTLMHTHITTLKKKYKKNMLLFALYWTVVVQSDGEKIIFMGHCISIVAFLVHHYLISFCIVCRYIYLLTFDIVVLFGEIEFILFCSSWLTFQPKQQKVKPMSNIIVPKIIAIGPTILTWALHSCRDIKRSNSSLNSLGL